MFSTPIFAGRTALVTGGSAGIGLAIAARLSALGASVAVAGRSRERLDDAVALLSEEAPAPVHGYAVDVRDPDAVAACVGQVQRDLGPVSLLVNNAAGNFRVDPLELSPNGWAAVVDIVLDGTWNVTSAVGRAAVAGGTPLAVVNIGTSAAETGSASTVHSASAKAGVTAMTKSLAKAWAPHGIRLNVLTPGLTEGTGGAQALYSTEEELAGHLAQIPLGRLARREDIASACAYLLSDYASYITGTTLLVDGGRQLGIH